MWNCFFFFSPECLVKKNNVCFVIHLVSNEKEDTPEKLPASRRPGHCRSFYEHTSWGELYWPPYRPISVTRKCLLLDRFASVGDYRFECQGKPRFLCSVFPSVNCFLSRSETVEKYITNFPRFSLSYQDFFTFFQK